MPSVLKSYRLSLHSAGKVMVVVMGPKFVEDVKDGAE